MPLIASADAARATRRRASSNGTQFWLTTFIGANRYTARSGAPPEPGAIYPMAFLVEQDADEVVGAHYHQSDQFQVMVGGSGRLGLHDVAPPAVHFAGRFRRMGRCVPAAVVCITSPCAMAGILGRGIWNCPRCGQGCVAWLGGIARQWARRTRPARMGSARGACELQVARVRQVPSPRPAPDSSGWCCPEGCCMAARRWRRSRACSSIRTRRRSLLKPTWTARRRWSCSFRVRVPDGPARGRAAGTARFMASVIVGGALRRKLPPDMPGQDIIADVGYSVGCLMVILGRMQLSRNRRSSRRRQFRTRTATPWGGRVGPRPVGEQLRR